MNKYNSKIIDLEDYKVIKKENSISFVNGAFDILHSAHIKLFEIASSYGDLVVGLNSDESIKKYKSVKRPIVPQNERALILSAIQYIKHIIIFEEPDPINLLNVIKPNFLIKGMDWPFDKLLKGEQEAIINHNIILINIPIETNKSTTLTINKILKVYDEHT